MLAWPDIVIIVGYFAIVLGLGVYFSRYMKSQKDFFPRRQKDALVDCCLFAAGNRYRPGNLHRRYRGSCSQWIGVVELRLAACLYHPVYNLSVDFRETLSKKRRLYHPRVYGKKIQSFNEGTVGHTVHYSKNTHLGSGNLYYGTSYVVDCRVAMVGFVARSCRCNRCLLLPGWSNRRNDYRCSPAKTL